MASICQVSVCQVRACLSVCRRVAECVSVPPRQDAGHPGSRADGGGRGPGDGGQGHPHHPEGHHGAWPGQGGAAGLQRVRLTPSVSPPSVSPSRLTL